MCGPSGMLSFTVAPFTRQLVSAVHLKPLTNLYDILGSSWSLPISRTLEILIEYSKSIENASFPWRWKSPSRILRILFSHNRAYRQYKKLLGDKLKYTRSLINLQSAESVATQSTGGTDGPACETTRQQQSQQQMKIGWFVQSYFTDRWLRKGRQIWGGECVTVVNVMRS